MLMICLRILSICGIILLTLLLLVVASLLLLLFCPVTYRISGKKDTEGFRISGRVKWLLGFFRIRFDYPEPGELAAKVFLFTLFRTKLPPEERDEEGREESGRRRRGKSGAKSRKGRGGKRQSREKESGRSSGGSKKNRSPEGKDREKEGISGGKAGKDESVSESGSQHSGENGAAVRQRNGISSYGEGVSAMESGDGDREEPSAAADRKEGAEAGTAPSENDSQGQNAGAGAASGQDVTWFGKILQKIQKIKYTIHSIYDKIREIWDNISYYLELLQEEDSRQFIAHVWRRTGNMFKSVRPRHIRADIRFGTGAPDTTGYLYGAFCMAAPRLGEGLNVTPDFEQAVLEADFTVSGHITGGVLLWNMVRIVLDRRLRTLLRKVKRPNGKSLTEKAA